MRTVEEEIATVKKLMKEANIDSLRKQRAVDHHDWLVENAPTSIAAHARLVHRDDTGRRIAPARHHKEWIKILEDVDKHRFCVVIAPPGYAKTTWFSHIYPTWRLGATGGRLRIGIVSRTSTQAGLLANAIRESSESKPFREAYPDCEPNYERGWTQTRFFFKNTPEGPNPAVFAAGIGSKQIQGRRFDEIVMDDPVNWEDVTSEEVMGKVRNWLKQMLLQRFPTGKGPPDGGGRMVVVLTRWGERDLVPEFEDLGFKIIRMPALGYWDRVVHPDGEIEYGVEPLWPIRESQEFLLNEQKEDQITFELVKQGNVAVLSGDMFDGAWFQRGTPPKIDEFDQIVQYVDTAGGKDRKKGDFFALATVGSTKEGKETWILDMVRHKKAAPEQERSVFTAYEKWSEMGHPPDLLVIEDVNEGTALYQRLVTSTRLPLKAYRPIKDKTYRSIPLSNAYRAGRVWHPEGEQWVAAYERELQAFSGDGRGHDDQVDAASGAYNQIETDAGMKLRVLS